MQEDMVKQSNDGALMLTTKRVVFDTVRTGGSDYMSIPLDQVAHCGLTTRESFLAKAAALLSVLAAMFYAANGQRENAYVALALAVVFGIAYLLSRKKKIVVASVAGGEIAVKATARRGEIVDFLKDVEVQRESFLKALERTS